MANPLLLSTWSWGVRANRAAWPTLAAGGAAIDAVEIACRDAEDDPANHTVGTGGFPDASGRVSLDAAVMMSPARCAGVGCVRKIDHPISLARRVMELTPHKLLVGDDADAFALANGFQAAKLLTDDARQTWEHWKATGRRDLPMANIEEQFAEREKTIARQEHDHDTIGVIAIDGAGTMCAGCTTSGLAYKLPGRVGDSPIIGHGLYCDPAIGAAVCTGHGELVMGVCGAFLAVESLRRGDSPAEAARIVLERFRSTYPLKTDNQVGVIVARPDGSFAGGSLIRGFRVAIRDAGRDDLIEPTVILNAAAKDTGPN
jgi:N4-(beta-N-acetylglucosaminyl)-L-asparaginase